MTTVTIPLSKRKLALMLAASCAFVALGIWLLGRASSYEGLDEARAWFGSISCVLFFGIGVIIFTFKLFDPRPGLILDERGVHRLGMFRFHPVIPWARITRCQTTHIRRTRILLIHVDDRNTPHSISSNNLSCDFGELERFMELGIAEDRSMRS